MANDPPAQRRRWRIALLAGLTGILAFAGWCLLETFQVYGAQVNPTIDSRRAIRSLSEQAAGVTPDAADEAWHLLHDVLDGADAVVAEINGLYADGVFAPRDQYDNELDIDRVRDGSTLPADLAPERRCKALLEERGVFETWARFAAGPPGIEPVTATGPMWNVYDNQFRSRSRSLARIGASCMRLTAADGDVVGAAALLDGQLALARTLAIQGTVLSWLTAQAIESLAIEEARHELHEMDFDAAACRAFFDVLDRHDMPPVTLPLRVERVQYEDTIQWCYSDDGTGNGYLVEAYDAYGQPTRVGFFGAMTSRFFDRTRSELMALYDPVMNGLIAAAETAPRDRPAAIAAWERATASASGWEGQDLYGNLVRGDMVRRAIARGSRVIAAIELHVALHGALPETLDVLVGPILDEPALDPLGQPYGFRLIEPDAAGRRYLLYFIGLDGTDDGGVEPAPTVDDNSFGALFRGAAGDWVINRPRRPW